MSLINRIFPTIAQDFSRALSSFEEPLFFNVSRRFPTTFPIFDKQNTLRPSVDISETDKNYVIEAEVPGMKKDDLSVEFLDDGTLILKGKIERGATTHPELKTVDATGSATQNGAIGATDVVAADTDVVSEPTFWTSERMRGHFQRSFQFPGKVDPEKVKAAYKDGLLSIVVPKVESHGKHITIE